MKELYRESKVVAEGPTASNNVAEYSGLLSALAWLKDKGLAREKIQCFGDSNLVVQQMMGNWKIKKGLYKLYAFRCQELIRTFPNISVSWIPREKNIADEVSKGVLRSRGIKFRIQKESNDNGR